MQKSKYKIHRIAKLLGLNHQVIDVIPFGERNIILTFILLVLFIFLSIPFSILLQFSLDHWNVLFLLSQLLLFFIELAVFRKYTELFTERDKSRNVWILFFSLIGLLVYIPTAIVLPNTDFILSSKSLSFNQLLYYSQNGAWLSATIIIFISILSLLPFYLIETGLNLYPIIIRFNKNINTI